MKVLFLAAGKEPDYMCDMVYHGLKSLPYVKLEELNPMHYMYAYYPEKSALYGKGFTLYGLLEGNPEVISVWQALSRIKKKYYDWIIYGSVRRYSHFFQFLLWHYPPDKIIAIDGEDHPRVRKFYVKRCRYFKRELEMEMPGVNPITFAIPKEHVLDSVPAKKKEMAHIIPGRLETYIYKDEKSYYQDYRDSVFGVTMKKGGWDCLRHYEILMNGCIPYFMDINKCPTATMTDFPKEIILETNSLRDSGKTFDHENYIRLLLDHMRKRLTTVQLAQRLLDR